MQWRELTIAGAWEFTPRTFYDARGSFLETFRADSLQAAVGHRLNLEQVNCSVSAAGVIRGVHFTSIPPGQAKYVTCVQGAVLDVVIDLRVGSPTFGAWESVLLDDVDRRAVYLSEGLGHAFCSLEDGSTLVYLCSSGYAPRLEHGVHPLDAELAIDWPTTARNGTALTHRLSEKDSTAPGLQAASEAGLLPDAPAVTEYIETLRG